jgi:hypothetical protein
MRVTVDVWREELLVQEASPEMEAVKQKATKSLVANWGASCAAG